ncbi:MAG: hypothetical protein ACREH9_04840, partial [Pseudomonadota bacterium]
VGTKRVRDDTHGWKQLVEIRVRQARSGESNLDFPMYLPVGGLLAPSEKHNTITLRGRAF